MSLRPEHAKFPMRGSSGASVLPCSPPSTATPNRSALSSRHHAHHSASDGDGMPSADHGQAAGAVSTICELIRTMIADPATYGSVPKLLQNCFDWTVKRHFSPEGQLLPMPIFESAEKNILTEMRSMQRDGDRLKQQYELQSDQLDITKNTLRDKDREVTALNKQLYDSESRELAFKTKLHIGKMELEKKELILEDFKANVATLHSNITKAKEADTLKLLGRTQDLRDELKNLYDTQRQQDELVKSQERELENFKNDLRDTEQLLAEARAEIGIKLAEIAVKNGQIGQLSSILGVNQAKLSDMQNVIEELRVSQGTAMVQDTMMKANSSWVSVRDSSVGERRALKSETAAPNKNIKAIIGPGETADVPPLLRSVGKVKPKLLLRNDVVHLALVSFSQLSLPPASTPNLDLSSVGGGAPTLGVAVGGPDGFSLEAQQPGGGGGSRKPTTNADFSQRGILSRTPPFAERLRAWISRGAGDSINQKLGGEMAYGILHGIGLWRDKEPDILMLDHVLHARLPPELHYHLFACVDVLIDKLTSEDESMYQEIRKALPVKTCERAVRDFLKHPAHAATAEDADYLVFQMTLDCNIPFISYRNLFEYDADGDRGYFYKALMEFIVKYSAKYYDDLEFKVLRKAVLEVAAEKPKTPPPSKKEADLAEGSEIGEDEEAEEDGTVAVKELSLEKVAELWEAYEPAIAETLPDLIKLLRSTIQGNAAADLVRKQQAEMAAARGGARRQMLLPPPKPVTKKAEEIEAEDSQDTFLVTEAVRALRQIVLVRCGVPHTLETYLGKRTVFIELDKSASGAHLAGLTPAKDCMSVGGHSLATTSHQKNAPSNVALLALSRRATSTLPVVLKLKLMKRD